VRNTGLGLIEWAPKVQAGDTVQLDWGGTPREVPKTIILTQVINHATEHRAQVMAILTKLGIHPRICRAGRTLTNRKDKTGYANSNLRHASYPDRLS
jgi:uncharacterized damage-inducible protein DinB